MKKGSLVLGDTNICIYRTLALIEPRILNRELLDQTSNLIHELTNNNFGCKIIITEIVKSELDDERRLFGEINKFCTEKLHLDKGSYKIQRKARSASKSIKKFCESKFIGVKLLNDIKTYPLHLPRVDAFYSKHIKRLKEITTNKIRYLEPYDQKSKLSQRPNFLPEKNDRLLLSQAVELKSRFAQDVYILSNDSDFTEFKKEIP